MIKRIREQLQKCAPELEGEGRLQMAAQPIPLPRAGSDSVDVLLQQVAGEITDLTMRHLGVKDPAYAADEPATYQ